MEIIDIIFEIYDKIEKINVELFKLEMADKINDKRFILLVEQLKKEVLREDRLLSDLKLEYQDVYENIEDILGNEYGRENVTYHQRFMDYIIANDPFANMPDDEDDEDEMDEEFSELDEEEIDEENDMDVEYLNQLTELYKLCENSLYLIYSSFLQEYLIEITNEELREDLLNLKYYHSFINHDIENALIMNNFNVPNVNYTNLYIMADMLGMDLDEVDEKILDCVYDMIVVAIEKLLSIKDIQYRYLENQAKALNDECFLKAGMALLSESDYKKVSSFIVDKINELANDYNKISTDRIYEIINDRKKYKSRVRKISMRLIED